MYSNLCQPWPIIWCGDITGLNPAVTGDAAMAATEILWGATGMQFGNCSVTIRPCRRDCNSQFPQDLVWSSGVVSQSNWGWPYPSLVNGIWMNLACGVCGDECSCTTQSEVVLSERIDHIVSVTVDGVAIPPGSGYTVYDGQRLVRTDGHQWPFCQDFTVTGGPGSWVIESVFGSPVPTLGKQAVGVLALEIAKNCSGEECNLPPSVQKVTRQGVTMERMNPKDLLENGLTGLYLPDLFISQINPNGIRDRARAYSPDLMPHRIQG